MDNDILFSEQQKLKQPWVWVLLISVYVLFLFVVTKGQTSAEQTADASSTINVLFWLLTALHVLTALFILNFKLQTFVKKDGIYVRFSPFHFSFKHFTWDSLSKLYIRKFSALSEYGGWGLRFGFLSNGTGYIFSGNKGLQLQFKNEKKLLISTNKPDELHQVLTNLGQIKDDKLFPLYKKQTL